MKTIFFPYHLENNAYCDLIVQALKQKNIEVAKLSYALKHPNYLLATKIINFNFFENIPNELSPIRANIQYHAKCLLLWFCKALGIKVIYTLHNKKQHDAKYIQYNEQLMKRLVRNADAIVSLCTEGKKYISNRYGKNAEEKTFVVPHPNYCIVSHLKSEEELRRTREKVKAQGKMLCTFLGAISPYKNVEFIIRAANELKNDKIIFLIAGNSKNKQYIDSLKKMSVAGNVIWDVRFIPQEEADQYIAASDLILLPYNKNSSLNSGSVFLAMTLQKTCVVPNIGSVQDLCHQEDVYVYDYSSEQKHYKAFLETIKKAIRDYADNPKEYSLKGKRLYNEMISDHSLECIGNQYLDLYQNLLSTVKRLY